MTRKKIEPFKLTPDNTIDLCYFTPWLSIIRRNGFYWVHKKTIDKITERVFMDIISAHGITVVGYNSYLNIYKLKQNAS